MKAVLLLTLLLVAALVQDTEAGWFRQLGRRVKAGAKRLGERVRNGARRVLDAVKDTARGRLRDELGRLIRGKRSALTLNRLDDVNAVDIAKTFNLDLSAVQEVFLLCDADKNGSLDGQEVLAFLGRIGGLAGIDSPQIPVKH